MIVRLLLASATLLLIFWGYRRWRRLPQEKRKKVAIKILLIACATLIILAVITGRLPVIGALIAGALAFAKFGFGTLVRLLPFLNVLRRSNVFSNPRFKTSFLDVTIDLNSGHIAGTILDGPHKGSDLLTLTKEQLKELEEHYSKRDKASYFLIRVLLQRGADPRNQHNNDHHSSNFQSVGDPSIDEAFQILGLAPNATKQDVVKAHRSLMQKLHPDRGGNDYLASRVNLAKEVLVKHLDQQNS